MSFRSNYWSCGKFADWLRGTPKPKAATGKDWGSWKVAAKETHPIRYWIVEEGLDYLQDFVNWPMDKMHDVRYYINNRWITKSHALTAHPRDIKPGQWCDVGNRFLPCLFNELVDFVEVEQAWHHCMWDEEARKKYRPSMSRRFFRFRTWRSPEAGMAYLTWAAGLKDDDGSPSFQALNAKEIIDLYVWWKHIYPVRPDPMDASGWSAYCELRRNKGYDLLDMEDKSPEEAAMCVTALQKSHEIEKEQNQEDEDMMIRLIKVRQGLWT